MTDYPLQRMADLWRRGLDTAQIAGAVAYPESYVYNHLELIKRLAGKWRADGRSRQERGD